jgi:hypothetical protein
MPPLAREAAETRAEVRLLCLLAVLLLLLGLLL